MATASNESYIESNPMRPVNEAVQEYRVREDGALAHYLQEREIEYHLALNVEQRRMVMDDIKAAKQLQDEEDKRARILTIEEQEELKTQDERIAEEMQAELLQKEVERKELEEQDSKIAQNMIERDKRAEEHQLSHDRRLAAKIEKMKLKEERKKQLSDEDLAWKLQEEERRKLKHRNESRNHFNTVIEMQDEELARFIHQKEEVEMLKWKEDEERKRRKNHKHSNHRVHSDEFDFDAELPHPSHHHMPSKSRSSRQERRSHDDELPSRPLHPPPREETTPVHVEEKKHRHKTKSSSSSRGESHSKRSSERPHRPAPPKISERASTDPRSRSKSNENLLRSVDEEITPLRRSGSRPEVRSPRQRNKSSDELSDDPWQRFPQSSSQRPRHSPVDEEIHYGEGFARLAEQESWSRNSKEDRKKKNKGDCKQQ